VVTSLGITSSDINGDDNDKEDDIDSSSKLIVVFKSTRGKVDDIDDNDDDCCGNDFVDVDGGDDGGATATMIFIDEKMIVRNKIMNGRRNERGNTDFINIIGISRFVYTCLFVRSFVRSVINYLCSFELLFCSTIIYIIP